MNYQIPKRDSWSSYCGTTIIVFWDVTSCSPVKRYERFGRTSCLHLPLLSSLALIFYPEDRNSTSS
jgi:hypothetical protein